MNEDTIEDFRQQLLELRRRIEADEKDAREDSRPVTLDQSSVGRLSRMDAMQMQQMARDTARRRQQQLLRIEGALRRIESGDFGYCAACGDEIGPSRLGIDPMATRCIACAE
ncbi:MAG: TraR/DksA family transcriptional regulator [Gammaproteobacteria bacterium]